MSTSTHPGKPWLRHVVNGAKLALVLACFIYIGLALDWERALAYCRQADPTLLILGILVQLGSITVIAAMLKFISDGKATFRSSFVALSAANALSLVLPAKLGEAAKFYLFSKETSASMGEIAEWIFWERFFISNIIVAVAFMGIGELLGQRSMLYLGGALFAVWAVIVFIWLSPDRCVSWVELLGIRIVRQALVAFILALSSRRKISFFAGVAAYSALCLALEALVVVLSLEAVAIKVSFMDALCIFSAAMIGIIVPASPGGVGVFEVAVATTLEWIGVEGTRAITAAVIMHAVFVVPMILSAVPILPQIMSVVRTRHSLPTAR